MLESDWGVQPQITVPMDPQQEQVAMKARYEQELFRKPVVKSTTRSATGPATTQAGGVIDPQLQRAIDTMVALVVLVGDREAGGDGNGLKTPMPALPAPAASTSSPVTMPTQPSTSTTPSSVPATNELKEQELPTPSTTPLRDLKAPATTGATTR